MVIWSKTRWLLLVLFKEITTSRLFFVQHVCSAGAACLLSQRFSSNIGENMCLCPQREHMHSANLRAHVCMCVCVYLCVCARTLYRPVSHPVISEGFKNLWTLNQFKMKWSLGSVCRSSLCADTQIYTQTHTPILPVTQFRLHTDNNAYIKIYCRINRTQKEVRGRCYIGLLISAVFFFWMTSELVEWW